jgi:FkbM family methyltransferase
MNLQNIKAFAHKHPLIKRLLSPVIEIRRHFLKKESRCVQVIHKHLCELLVEDPVIRVKEFQGVFLIDRRSDVFKRLLIRETYEPSMANLVLRYLDRDRDVIDVGANIGFYTVLFAQTLREAKVLAIEPTSNSLGRLRKNIQLNDVAGKTIIFEGALSDFQGRGELKALAGKEEYSTLGRWRHPSIREKEFTTYEIEISTIDSLAGKYSLKPGLIKIDVEGMESSVLRGARDTLINERPVILSEVSDYLLKENDSSSAEVIKFLESLNYVIVSIESPELRPDLIEFGNILCVPRELENR